MRFATHVFVVDDDPSARNGLVRLLRTAGSDVRGFASANEFLDALGPEASGCIVLDARMPGLSGEELADDNPETIRKARQMKAAGFFRKPVDSMALLDAIEWALRPNCTNGNGKRM
ncbi:MAG: response regulator transcription factor [Planctomycetota bacterium]|jgi:FixJ family two-component response regulator